MKESMELKETFNASPEQVYEAWLDPELHSLMTGGEATGGQSVGEDFSAWDGYITGKTLDLKLNEEIVQSWRTSEFAESDEDSRLVIRLKETREGTELTLIHTNIPEGQTQYRTGWQDHYFTPMKEYFD